MARIPEEELQRIKQEIELVALVRAKGIELKPHGDNLIGLCPFHDDHSPSLVVTPKKNLWHCLGACQTGGSVIDWVMKAEGVSFRHAVELLREDKLSSLAASTPVTKKSTITKLEAPITLNADDQTLLHQVIEYYQEQLTKTPATIEYLQKRKIYSEEVIGHFKLGFADRTLGLRIPFSNRAEGKELRDRLQKIGVIRESGHEHFNGSIVFPIINDKGEITEIYGRKICDRLRPGTPKHTYLPGAHKGIFNLPSLLKRGVGGELILCESIIDALSFWISGFKNVTCSYGIEGFTEDHLNFFIQQKINKIYIAYDADEPGDKAADKLAQKLISEGIECYRINFPKDTDANEFICQQNPSTTSTELSTSSLGASNPQIELQRLFNLAVGYAKASVIGSTLRHFDKLSTTQAQGERKAEESGLPLKADDPSAGSGQEAGILNINENGLYMTLGDRYYRIRGMEKNLSYDLMKVNIRVEYHPSATSTMLSTSPLGAGTYFYIDTLDLYNARNRNQYISQAAEELELKPEIIKRDLGRVLLKLEEYQDQLIKKTLEPAEKAISLTPEERETAKRYLEDPKLAENILNDFKRCGIVGEETNKLIGYLGAVSRKLEEPLAIIIQSSSAAGKTSLMDAVLSFVPQEELIKYSAMTGQSLFYMGNTSLKYKILAIAEEEGVRQASYSLKLLQSDKKLKIASTGKDPDTGKLITHEYEVEGPVMLFMTTTAIEIDEELINRCVVLTVNEDREQTRAIHQIQRQLQTLEGLIAKEEKEEITKLHQNIQRLIKPIKVVNPYATKLTFHDVKARLRRDHMKYLTLINAVTLLYQYQRPKKTKEHKGKIIEYIEVELSDIELANRLANEVLGRSIDELPPQTRNLLQFIHKMATDHCLKNQIDQKDYFFSRRQIREYTGWSNSTLHKHLSRLEELEYLILHRGARGHTFVYELSYHGEENKFMIGLATTTMLKSAWHSPLNSLNSPSIHPQFAVNSPLICTHSLAAK
jgi:DNA primase catalytic core